VSGDALVFAVRTDQMKPSNLPIVLAQHCGKQWPQADVRYGWKVVVGLKPDLCPMLV